MPNCLYQLAQDFQTLIVGALGFLGVIGTLWMNAYLSRKQHERIISHERKTLRIALHAELELARRAFFGISTPSDDSNEDQGVFFPEYYSQAIYQSLISKIGILSLNEVSAVTEAHALIGELPIRLHLLSSGHHESFERPGYIYISTEHAETAMSIYRNFLPKIEHALKTLQQSEQ